MALGKPTVANDQPDQSETLGASGAGVAVEYTADNFAAEVIKLLQDGSLRQQMSAAGLQWVADHRSYASLTPPLANAYRELTK